MKKRYVLLLIAMFFFASAVFAQSRETCPNCNGRGTVVERCSNCRNGAVYCTSCDYKGTIDSRCYSCSGSGSVTKTRNKKCDNCYGQRYFVQEKQEPCGQCRNGQRPVTRRVRDRYGEIRETTEYVNCTSCGGSGTKTVKYNAACRYCGGTGVRGQESYTESCRSCNGRGYTSKTCSRCGGKGCYSCPQCSGYANIKNKCGRCNGNGYIYTQN